MSNPIHNFSHAYSREERLDVCTGAVLLDVDVEISPPRVDLHVAIVRNGSCVTLSPISRFNDIGIAWRNTIDGVLA